MGMAASQARYLSLVARQSNLEYQGQQINQERTILSQQVSELYNSLLALQVPTPPSTQEFTTVEYAGVDGATNFTLGSVKPSGENYLVEIRTTATGAAISPQYGTSVCSTAPDTIKGTDNYVTYTMQGDGTYALTKPSTVATGDIIIDNNGILGSAIPASATAESYYTTNDDSDIVAADPDSFPDSSKTYYPVVTDPSTYDSTVHSVLLENESPVATSYPLSTISSFYINDGGKLTQLTPSSECVVEGGNNFTIDLNKLPAGATIFKAGEGTDEVANPEAGKRTIAGQLAYDFEEARALHPELDWNKYEEAIRNTYGQQEKALTKDDFYVFFTISDTGITEVNFAIKLDVKSDDNFAKTFKYIPDGSFTKSEEKDQCLLEFDASGRIVKIGIPDIDKVEGKVVSWREIELQATTVTDQVAYDNAMTEYEYEQYVYDKKQQDINLRTEKIQQMDRNLELKLQRLDNERKQITTEIEALDKVINENIEKSYKTFSG